MPALGSYFEKVEGDILATPLTTITSEVDEVTVRIKATPELLEEAFENVTVSLPMHLGFEGWTTTVPITVYDWVNTYEFTPLWLQIPYASIILISLLLNLIGLYSVIRNGVPASGSTFIQIVTTTSAPASGLSTLREKAAKFSQGGHNYSKDLLNLKLKFGELLLPERRGVEMATGTPDTGRTYMWSGNDPNELGEAQNGPASWGFGTSDELRDPESRRQQL